MGRNPFVINNIALARKVTCLRAELWASQHARHIIAATAVAGWGLALALLCGWQP